MAFQSPLTVKFVVPTSPTEVVSKTKDKNELEKYIVKSTEEYVSPTLPYADPIIVDLQCLLDSEEELHKFESFLGTWGAFQLVNHGIESSKLDQVFEIAKEFFHLPLEEKEKYQRTYDEIEELTFDKLEGWGVDSRMAEGQPFTWGDRLLLGFYPLTLRNSKFWLDESLPNFRVIVEEYATELKRIREILMKAVIKVLKLPEENVLSKYAKEGTMLSKFSYYPPCPYPDRILGSRPHTDSIILTIVQPDKEVEGLHIEKDDQWYILPIIPNALVVNAGDMLEMLSNGKIKSAVHRVATNAERERISIVSPSGPTPNSTIGPLKELTDNERPPLYPTLKNSSQVTSDYYAQGKIFIKEIRKYGPHIVQQDNSIS